MTSPDWEGVTDQSGHRTVGPHRAWHSACSEWCYPQSLCPCCDQVQVPDVWKDLHPGELLHALHRRMTSLPESRAKRVLLALLEGRSDDDDEEPA